MPSFDLRSPTRIASHPPIWKRIKIFEIWKSKREQPTKRRAALKVRIVARRAGTRRPELNQTLRYTTRNAKIKTKKKAEGIKINWGAENWTTNKFKKKENKRLSSKKKQRNNQNAFWMVYSVPNHKIRAPFKWCTPQRTI
jgi:hypothetical protein